MSEGVEAWRHTNVGRMLHSALNRFETRVFEILAANGHDEARYTHLTLTRHLDLNGTRNTELARRAGVTKQAMGEIVEQCEQLGLVTRIPDERDARAKIVKFTDPGIAWIDSFREAILQAEQEMRNELGCLRMDAISQALSAYGHDYDTLGSNSAAGAVERKRRRSRAGA